MKQYKAWELLPEEKVFLKSDVDEAIAELKDKLQLDEDEMAGFLQLEEECGGGDLRNYIAELKAENERLKDELNAANNQCENLINSATDIMLRQDKVNDNKCAELLHQKYKRCLAMARWCASRSLAWMADPADDILHKSDFYDKWKLRWRKLAEKFKPNNSTAQ